MRSANLRALVVGALVTSLLTVACGGGSGANSSAPAAGGTVVQRLQGNFDNFDLLTTTAGTPGTQVASALYDRMVALDAKGNVIPYLARSWTQTPTSIVFTLRRGATCSDGTPVTATVVANSFNVSFQNSNTKRLVGSQTAAATADDSAGTVTVTIPKPFSDLLYGFADPYLGVFCPQALADHTRLNQGAFGSGPYTIDSVVPGDSVTLKVRTDWSWGPQGRTARSPGFPAKLVYKVVDNDTTAANLLLTGGLDLALVSGPDVTRLKADSSLTNLTSHSHYTYSMLMNQNPGRPTADMALRKAFSTAIDPKAWNQAAYGGDGTLSSSFITSDTECYDPATQRQNPQPSMTEARNILKNAGYTLSGSGQLQKDGSPVSITMLAYPALHSGPEYVANQLQALGVQVNQRSVDFTTYATVLRSENWDVTWSYFPSEAPVPSLNIIFMTGASLAKGGQNRTTIHDPVIEDAAATGLKTTGPDKCKSWNKVQERLLQQYDLVPLSSPNDDWFSKKVSFIPGSPRSYAWALSRTA